MSRRLPFDYAIRNLGRRPLRTGLTAVASALVGALLVATTSFVRGLDTGFSNIGRDDTVILLSSASERDVVRSAISPTVPELLAANVASIVRDGDAAYVSPEIHMATNLRLGEAPAGAATGTALTDPPYPAFVRGITPRAFLVHSAVTLIAGNAPRTGEVIVGRLAAAKMNLPEGALAPGRRVRFEGGTFTVAGTFAAPGTTIESEIWTPLNELKGLVRRDDISVVFARATSAASLSDISLFARRRLDLELVAIPTSTYYREVADYFVPIRRLAWMMAAMIVAAAVFGGANTLNAAVQDRLRELAMLRAVGYSGFALVQSLMQESVVLAAAGGLVGLALARVFVAGSSIRIAMSAFSMAVDAPAIAIGSAGVILLGIMGTIPAALRVMRLPIATALKEP